MSPADADERSAILAPLSDPAPIIDPYLAADRPEGASTTPNAQRTSSTAITAVTLGAFSFVCLPLLGGVLAIAFGIAAKGEIEQSGGKRGGVGLAWAGIGLGALNLSLGALALVGLALSLWSRPATSVAVAPPPVPAPTFVAPVLPPSPPTPHPKGAGPKSPAPPAASFDAPIVRTKVGGVELVDVAAGAGPLTRTLESERDAAKKGGETLLLWTVVPDCKPCNGVAAALPDPRMQRALGRARLVRVDVREFAVELSYLGIPTDKIPGFALLGAGGRPLDYVNGGEWDEDIARNIAPVLGKFVSGQYRQRRHPWRGPARDDETQL